MFAQICDEVITEVLTSQRFAAATMLVASGYIATWLDNFKEIHEGLAAYYDIDLDEDELSRPFIEEEPGVTQPMPFILSGPCPTRFTKLGFFHPLGNYLSENKPTIPTRRLGL